MKKKNHKYIFVIGGVMSGVGKGIATSSIGKILQSKNYKVNPIKVDPYLNVDAGTMNPTEHGEVFVLDSGLECDQDLGNYERFMDIDLKPDNYMTSGMVYQYVIEKERNLGYKGKCVEAIPHITGEITRRIQKSAEMSGADISIIEIGGTVGDYQNIMFIEAARTLKLKNPDDVIFVLVSYLPIPSTLGEMKTRPTQNAVRNLNSYGVQPEIIIARGAAPLDERRKEKIAVSCNIAVENVVSAPDVESVYDVPINFEKDNLSGIILKTLKLKKKSEEDMKEWRAFADRVKSSKEEVNIAVIGKYFDTGDFVLSDAYISVIEAAKYSAYSLGKKLKLTWLNSKDLESGDKEVSMLGDFDGVIVPGGFGESGIEGKLKAIKFVRENKIPYLGLCYGMQLAVIEYARNVLGLKDANTTEIDPNSKNPVIDIMFNQKKNMEDGRYGGTMRLGAYKAVLEKDTIARAAYGEDEVWERHRHRYEVNSDYIKKIESAGMIFSGKSPNGTLMEIAELPKSAHPFFLGTQFHPEFKARPLHPHPLFTEFMKVAIARKKK
ncbi:MAG: CTP synthetase [Parcubacteria group bacterium GW2011_GWA1_40_21]|nr:MAG: CTP synthetase [Parcubacteria group bacterium GW2011_GWA1_40_21]